MQNRVEKVKFLNTLGEESILKCFDDALIAALLEE